MPVTQVLGECAGRRSDFYFFMSRANSNQNAFQLTTFIIISPNVRHSSLPRFPKSLAVASPAQPHRTQGWCSVTAQHRHPCKHNTRNTCINSADGFGFTAIKISIGLGAPLAATFAESQVSYANCVHLLGSSGSNWWVSHYLHTSRTQ